MTRACPNDQEDLAWLMKTGMPGCSASKSHQILMAQILITEEMIGHFDSIPD